MGCGGPRGPTCCQPTWPCCQGPPGCGAPGGPPGPGPGWPGPCCPPCCGTKFCANWPVGTITICIAPNLGMAPPCMGDYILHRGSGHPVGSRPCSRPCLE